jgi:hypothetical protein
VSTKDTLSPALTVKSPTVVLRSRGGMKSVSFTAPSAVSNVVSRISVSPRYRLLIREDGSRGLISQRPCSRVPSSAAKQASESKRGQHSQSMEPPRDTNTAVSQSPIRA